MVYVHKKAAGEQMRVFEDVFMVFRAPQKGRLPGPAP
jgi:hypothetical protein